MEKEKPFNKKGLIQQYMDLEKEWDTVKRASTQKLRRTRSLTETKTNMVRGIRALMDNSSPRELMSCLQQAGQKWEIIRERKAGFESGRIKGRRLFEGSEKDDEEGEKEKGSSSPLPPASVLLSLSSSSSLSSATTASSFLCDECTERERELVGQVAAETKTESTGGRYKYRWLLVVTLWVAVGLLVGGISGVFSPNKEYRRDFLVPT